MSSEAPFDPCRQWLGIDAVDLGDARRVLGVKPDERDPVVVRRAAEARLSLLRQISPGPFERARAGLVTRVEESRDKLLAEIASAGAQAAPRVERFSMPPPPSSFAGAAPPTPLAAAGPVAPAPWAPTGAAAPRVPPPPPPPAPPPPVPGTPGGDQIRIRTAVYRKETPVAGIIALMLLLAGAAGGLAYYKIEMDKKRAAAATHKREIAKSTVEQPVAPAKPAKRDPVSNMTRVDGRTPVPPPGGKSEDPDENKPFAVPDPDEKPMVKPGRPGRGMKGRDEDGEADAEAMKPDTMKPDKKPEAKPEPRPAPKPEGPTAEEKAALAKLDEPLREALAALRDKDGDKAVEILKAAAGDFRAGPAAARLRRWQQLAQYTKGFYGFRDKALAAVKTGNEFDVNNQKVAIVEADDDKIIYRSAGGNKTVARDKLPAGIVLAIVTNWFDKSAANHLYLGAYHLTKAETDVDRARGDFETATAGGADASELLPLLDDPLFQEKGE